MRTRVFLGNSFKLIMGEKRGDVNRPDFRTRGGAEKEWGE